MAASKTTTVQKFSTNCISVEPDTVSILPPTKKGL